MKTMSKITPDMSFERTLRFDQETFETLIKDNFLLQTSEELVIILGTLDEEGVLDDIIDRAYDAIEDELVRWAQKIGAKENK
jgi:hypothetical protein